MSQPPTSQARIALVGNPNCGKTTLFNALTGLTAKTGNYPGVTVEHREGRTRLPNHEATVIDLPGTYSLVPRSDDEVVAVSAVVGEIEGSPRPDLVVCVVDASRLDRGLYLLLELAERGLPLLVALTMTDSLEGDAALDVEALGERFGVPVVAASGRRPAEVEALRSSLAAALASPTVPSPEAARYTRPGDDDEAVSRARERYTEIERKLAGLDVPAPKRKVESRTDRLDAVLLHPVGGPFAMVVVFGLLFEALFTWATPFMDAVEAAIGWTGEQVAALVPDSLPLLQSLLVDGVVAGVGNVLVFVPQIAALFFFLGVLEDSGYLARAAFLLDRLMARVGLSGKAFVPLLSGFACAVPALMATRTIGSERDRITTIMVTPLVSCSARLPVYLLILAALFKGTKPIFGVLHVGTVMLFAMYGLGLVTAIAAASVFRRTLLKGPPPAMVLELPPYRAPVLTSVLRRVLDRVKVFLVDAGTIILAVTVVLWGLFTFPQSEALQAELERDLAGLDARAEAGGLDEEQAAERRASLEGRAAQAQLAHSVGGRLGHLIEPVIEPLGFNWEMGVAIVASFAAREVFVSSLGLVYGLGEADEESPALREVIREKKRPDGRPLYTPLVGVSLMVFFALAMQCMSTLAATRRETRSWKWPVIQFGYMTALAWLASLAVYQVGRLLGFG